VFRIAPGSGWSVGHVPTRLSPATAPWPRSHTVVLRLDARDIGEAECRELGAQLRITAVSGIHQHGARAEWPAAHAARIWSSAISGLVAKPIGSGTPGLVTSQGISGPFLRQIEPVCDRQAGPRGWRSTVWTATLAIVLLAELAAILGVSRPTECPPLLGKAGIVDNPGFDRARSAQTAGRTSGAPTLANTRFVRPRPRCRQNANND